MPTAPCVTRSLLVAAIAASAGTAFAQTNATGGPVAPPPGMTTGSGANNCSGVDNTGMPNNPSDPNCYGTGPGFATASLAAGAAPRPRITALVRIDAAIAESGTRLPESEEIQTVGAVTMVKSLLPGLNACFSAGKGWNLRSGAATSTTCLTHKGDVLAYQECKPRERDKPMVCTTVVTRDPRKD